VQFAFVRSAEEMEAAMNGATTPAIEMVFTVDDLEALAKDLAKAAAKRRPTRRGRTETR
jgi:hypothetical protein